ncbi:MAG: GntR family transcriptional regulator [Candidatus Limnocylindrales bacterium]
MIEQGYRPQYRRIEVALRERIAAMRPGDRLPSDTELCAEFGVSRMTARNALQRLAEEGIVARHPGRGSFVAEPPAHRRANRLMTFTQETRRRGRVPSSRILARSIRPSTAAEAARLGQPVGTPVVHLRRLRCADGEPIALETAILVAAGAEWILTIDLEHGSLHEALARAGRVLRRGTGTITATAATAEDARLLGIRRGDPLLVERRVIDDSHGRPIEATESRYSGDRYALDIRFDVEGSDDPLPGDAS